MDVIESHGAKIPVIGFGTMTLKDNLCVELVEAALHLGYRHLDTAQNYGNEREVGEGIRASGVPREDVFITTKVWFNRLAPGDLERSVDESLERLKLPWVDLLLIHWPNAQIPLAGSIDALCKVKRAGLAKHIGVANFTVAMLDEATKTAGEPLALRSARDRYDLFLFEEPQRHLRRRLAMGAADALQHRVGGHLAARQRTIADHRHTVPVRRRQNLGLVEIGMGFDLQCSKRLAGHARRLIEHGDGEIGHPDMLGEPCPLDLA